MWQIVLLVVAIAFIVLATSKLKLHPFLALLIAAFGYGILSRQMSLKGVVDSINDGFGATIGQIGIVILAGSIIGTFLEKSGGAARLAQRTVDLVGPRRVPLAMGLIGFVVSIPVFCDSGFILLAPLARSLSSKARVPLAAGVMSLSLGLYATHTMVPPTPGPVAAAAVLAADLGRVILFGLIVGVPTLVVSWLFSVKIAARVKLAPDESLESDAPLLATDGPSVAKSLAPILTPIVLILLRSVCMLQGAPLVEGWVAEVIGFLGQPVVALLIGAFLAFLLPARLTTNMLSTSGWVGEAVLAAATIILITGCGGAFGRVLQNSHIADVVSQVLGDASAWGLWLPFVLAAAIKTAQGSSTVSMITTAGIVAPMLDPLGLATPTGRALAVVAIGAGSMVVSHVNDSYFWIVTQLSAMTVRQGYRLQTLGTLVEGLAAAMAVWVLGAFLL
ncbi:MAG: GntP family permease [Sedimentisphaerales bacterium]|jgi:GntP family gluconate:H+ symporter|nr:GntP family permease [Sedimentisphaerales bacterium]HNY78995.1 GntP family permease [Sedimentisphaerales bacterium]HOC64056.1 GntP family permease [Sedimentisphaerales bacterium]HOH64909.1 GntP family permease [Sedimentisphaerales bacterium]HQA89988.1 GntP family permease [Sedimentisphaerales bacterium]